MAEQGTADTGPNAKTTTKAALVDAGTQLILEKGYHHTGIQEVLQAAGVPKGSFYYYFPSKEAFGRAVIAQFAAAYVARLERWLGETTQSPLTRLHRHLDETLTHFEERSAQRLNCSYTACSHYVMVILRRSKEKRLATRRTTVAYRWPAGTTFKRIELEVEDRLCPVCHRYMHVCDHRYHALWTFEGPTQVVNRLVRCPDTSCQSRGRTFSPEAE